MVQKPYLNRVGSPPRWHLFLFVCAVCALLHLQHVAKLADCLLHSFHSKMNYPFFPFSLSSSEGENTEKWRPQHAETITVARWWLSPAAVKACMCLARLFTVWSFYNNTLGFFFFFPPFMHLKHSMLIKVLLNIGFPTSQSIRFTSNATMMNNWEI